MNNVKIILEDGTEKEVYSIFYLYNSKYYFIYTEKEIDENGYVILHLVQIGKEIKNTPDGPLDTGYMVGVKITDENEWKNAQQSITEIVNDKKRVAQNMSVQYLPINMLSTLKIVGKRTFRLLKDIVQNNFGLDLSSSINSPIIQGNIVQAQPVNTPVPNQIINPIAPISPIEPIAPIAPQIPSSIELQNTVSISEQNNNLNTENQIQQPIQNTNQNVSMYDNQQQNTVVIDYRTKFFEEQEKNENLQLQIDELNKKLNDIKNVLG